MTTKARPHAPDVRKSFSTLSPATSHREHSRTTYHDGAEDGADAPTA
ncbi:hypothetical protein IMZ48_19930 [Candidatus Bathyarchaeota archaeon]|nr:hypothetical protein [Candidatus Bathyarchaeota archaeon]